MINVMEKKFNALLAKISDTGKKASVSRFEVEKLLNDNLEVHSAFTEVLGSLSPNARNSLRTSLLSKKEQLRLTKLDQIYNLYTKNLTGEAKKQESKAFMESIISLHKRFIMIQSVALKNLNNLLPEDSVSPGDIKVSHVLLMSFIEYAKDFNTWSLYFMDLVTATATELDSAHVYKYRIIALLEDTETTAHVVSMFLGYRGRYTLTGDINVIRKKGGDLRLSTSGFSLSEYADKATYAGLLLVKLFYFTNKDIDKATSNNLVYTRNVFSFFWWIVDAYYEHKQAVHDRNVETKNYLENMVIVLRSMLMDDATLTEEERTQIEERIAAYSAMIAQYDEKIQKFLKS